MKSLLKSAIFTTLSLYAVSRLFEGISFSQTSTLIITGIVLTLLTMFVRPFLKILLLPVNIVTFGLFSWVINILVLYLAMLLVPGFSVSRLVLPAFVVGPFAFPQLILSHFWSLFAVSLLVSLGNTLLSLIL